MSRFAVLLACTAAIGLSSAAIADTPHTPSRTLTFTVAELMTDDGVSALEARLEDAAESLCQSLIRERRTPAIAREIRACTRQAFANAHGQLETKIAAVRTERRNFADVDTIHIERGQA